MCGILGVFDIQGDTEVLRPQVLEMAKKIRHRGPDWSGIFSSEKAILAHERLAIIDPKSGKQPLFNTAGNLVLTINGEIYNHRELRALTPNYQYKTQLDSESILALYELKGVDMLDDLNGIFAFAVYDIEKDEYFVARDHVGIIPLYHGWDEKGTYYVSSELKALEGICVKIETFPPGHYVLSSRGATPQKWYERDWKDYSAVKHNVSDIDALRSSLEDAVHRQLMSDVPYGVLLSGGLDSSVIAAITKKFAS